MATNPNNFELDLTGLSKLNRKENEIYHLPTTGGFIRAISPTMGCFFTDSVVITDTQSKRILVLGADYVFTEFYSSFKSLHGKSVAATIVIINQAVFDIVSVSYNFLGSHYVDNVKTIAQSINAEAGTRTISNLQWGVVNNLKPFLPPDYKMQIGSGVGFEAIVYGLEKIRSTIMMSDFELDQSIGIYIDDFTSSIYRVLDTIVNSQYKEKLLAFTKTLTRELLGLGKVVNLPLVSSETARYAAVKGFQFDESQNGYVALKAISVFKEELYNNLTSSEHTGIGKHYGVYGLPLIDTLMSLKNGAGIIINSLESSLVSGYNFNKVVYPDHSSPSDAWSIVKLTNNATGQGGVLWGTNLTTGELYVGRLNDVATHSDVLTWVKLYGEYDMDRALKALTEHSYNIENPHNVNKHQIGLGFVENLPMADAEDLACRVPSDKYVSHKFLLAFMSTYMTGLKTAKDMKEMNCDENEVIRNIKLIFAPCGPCGPCCEPNVFPVTTTTSNTPIVDPAGQLTGWFCENNQRWDILTDGFGGTKTIAHVYGYNDEALTQDGCIPQTTTTALN